MSDESERETQNLGTALLTVYSLFIRVCAILPIPITLPDFEDDVLHGQAMNEAITRLVEVIGDEPLDDDLQAGIWAAALHWLSASHLFSRYMGEGEQIVALEVRINVLTAHDTLHAVENVLLDQRFDE